MRITFIKLFNLLILGTFVAFYSAPLILINALVHELSVVDSNRTLEALRQFEAVAEAQQYFVKE